jgi:hypothetical protein
MSVVIGTALADLRKSPPCRSQVTPERATPNRLALDVVLIGSARAIDTMGGCPRRREGGMPDGVRIDTDVVGAVGRGLRDEADGGFAAAAMRGAGLHRHGVEFGARITPSAVVTDAKNRYADALAGIEANLRAHRTAAAALASAAEEIARLLAAADMTSAEAQQRVRDLIDDTVIGTTYGVT